MTSVCGHVLTIDFHPKFNNWDRVDPVSIFLVFSIDLLQENAIRMLFPQLELFSCPTERKEATPKLRITSFLAQEARGCDYLVLWLDCDKEGENICFEVIEAVKKSLRRPVYHDDVMMKFCYFLLNL